MILESQIKILLVEDNDDHAEIIGRILERAFDSSFDRVNSLHDGCVAVSEKQYDAVLLDLTLPDSSPRSTYCQFFKCNPLVPVIILSSLEDEELARGLLKEGAQDYIRKGDISTESIRRSIRYAIERKTLQKELKRYDIELEKKNQRLEKLINIRTDKLSKSEERYRLLIKNAPVAILMFFENGEVDFANPEFHSTFGYPSNDKSISVFDLVGEEEKEIVEEIKKELRENSRKPVKRKLYLKTKNGKKIWSHINIAPVVRRKGKENQYLLFIDDHSDLVKKEEIEKKKRVAEQANLAKTEFLTNISHEIRTPLTAICGFIDILSHKNKDKSLEQYLGGVQRNSKHLLILVKDLLDLAKIESGQMEVSVTDFSLVEEISSIIEMVQPLVFGKPVRLEVHYSGLVPRKIHSDMQKFRQILINLINNAVKYTEQGTVHVHVKVKYAEPKGDGSVYIRVTDPGHGISEEDQQQLFLPFVRGERKEISDKDGIGVGLALSKKLAKNLGGDIRLLHSSPGKGSEFEVYLPVGNFNNTAFYRSDSLLEMEKKEMGRQESEVRFLLKNRKILVVEDVDDLQFLTERLLTEVGVKVDLAGNGEIAVEKVKSNRYDLVLMDLSMPVKDGFQAIKEIRANGYDGKIVALTAHAFKSERDRVFQSGFNGFIAKPFSRGHLLHQISDMLLDSQLSKSQIPFEDENGSFRNLEIFDVFRKNYTNTLSEIKHFMENGEMDQIKNLAHKLKGSAGCYGFREASQVAGELESLCQSPKDADWQEVSHLVQQLTVEEERIKRGPVTH